MILDKIYTHKLKEVSEIKERIPLEILMKRCRKPSAMGAFGKAIKGDEGMRIIAEVKRASPSAGIIRKDFDYIDIAAQYESGGASAISVLTDREFFKGDLSYLAEVRERVKIPLLRKDFLIDPYQIYEARAAGADAVLLIARLLTTEQIDSFLSIAHDLGMECLVEIHNTKELEQVLETGSNIIGINNRDLDTFETNLETSLKLRALMPDGKIFVSESGIKTRSDVRRLEDAGFDAILVGETLMRSNNISLKMRELLGGKAPLYPTT
ncbi:MAG: indole-3-glycerol phosphate synthase TrpC [Candidatus Scalindua sp.]|nr:indole-3-glycerol phosphate synthase TrpC [Candidatus Scalindua sp.]